MGMTTWRALIVQELLDQGESWRDIVDSTLDDRALDKEFDAGYGVKEGTPFTLWTEKRVYFPAKYDGEEWCASVSRNPDGNATEHIGGRR